jgi:outer membrane protein OmpA-like peptidoglycan-associated protein
VAANIRKNLTFAERGNKMLQKELTDENKEIKNKAYELYEKHGFKDGNDFVDWLEAEKETVKLETEKQSGKLEVKRQTAKRSRAKQSKQYKQMRNILLAIVAMLCVFVLILLVLLFKKSPKMELSEKSLSDLKVMILVLDPNDDEKVVVFGDTQFDYNKSTLSQEAETLLEKDVQVLKDNPQINVRMAGFTSAQGSEKANQELSEKRANTVRDFLIEKGIAPERITVIGYGRTKPAVYEVTPGNINTEEAKANMRVLFEVVVK